MTSRSSPASPPEWLCTSDRLAGGLTACAPDEPDDPEPAASPAGNGWTALANLPQQRTEHSVVALAGQVYVAGGITADGQLPTELFIYDPAADEWRQGAPIPEGRHHAPLAAHDGTVYLVGGYTGAVGENLQPTDTLLMYDVDADSWREGPPLPEPRGAHAAAVTGDEQPHVVGGVSNGVRDEHFAFDPATETWRELPPMPTARHGLGAGVLENGILVVGGGPEPGLSVSGVAELWQP